MPLSDEQTTFKLYLKSQLFNAVLPLKFTDLEKSASGFASFLFSSLSEAEIAEVVQELTHENAVTMDIGDSIVAKSFRPWIANRKAETETPRWSAYKDLLVSRDWEANVIEALDAQTDDVVELLGNPLQTDGIWPRRGLLLGEVQSGKTATYLGVLNKALDYGYRVIVVIGGHTEDLRQQTQARFDTDLLGVDSETWEDGISNAAIRYVGVGANSDLRAHLMTTVRHDFSKSKKGASITWVNGDIPTVFITKKTPSLLDNIRKYIKSQTNKGQLDIPLIVVDDESDWGSPNTAKEDDPTKVNAAIRALLDVSARSSYLAITATPFANIFIDDQSSFNFIEQGQPDTSEDDAPGTVLQDLFPSDYIRVMSPPSTYLGIATYFPEEGHASVRTDVTDCTKIIPIKHKNYHPVLALPASMKQAIMQFLLGTAVRRIREGEPKPASMLINVSRFKSVEKEVADHATEYLRQLVAVATAELARHTGSISDVAKRIKDEWEQDFADIVDVEWNEVAQKLVQIAAEFRVDLVNGDTAAERTKRRKLMTVAQREADNLVPKIVVGGDILSRGLTLDGLQVSYFVREPRTMDTLMQMGRWFGYRPNFEDLVRIWMPETTQADFTRSAEVMDELRESLLEMKARELEPKDFGLRVRVHPNSVDIVAGNKGKATAVVDIGPTVWENRLAESYDLPGEESVDEANRAAADHLIRALGRERATTTHANFASWENVPLQVITEFFDRFQGDKRSEWFGRGQGTSVRIADSFDATPGNNRWSVVLVNSGEGDDHELAPGFSVNASIRNKMGRSKLDGHLRLDRRRVAAPNDLYSSLSLREKAKLEANWPAKSDGTRLSKQAASLATIDHPILLLYVVAAEDPTEPSDTDFDMVQPGVSRFAVTIAFPKMDNDEFASAAKSSKKYQVNQVYWRAYNGYVEDLGDDVIEGENS